MTTFPPREGSPFSECWLKLGYISPQSPCFSAIAISESINWNATLKPKQVNSLEAVYFGRDVVVVLPTGYGIIFHLLPALLFGKFSLL